MLQIENYYPIDIPELKRRWDEVFGELDVSWHRLQMDYVLKTLNDTRIDPTLLRHLLNTLPWIAIVMLDTMKKEKEAKMKNINQKQFVLGQKVLFIDHRDLTNKHQGIVVEILESDTYLVEFKIHTNNTFNPVVSKTRACFSFDLYYAG